MSVRWIAIGLALGLGTPAFAQVKKVEKAEKAFAKGDRASLGKAWDLVGAAKSHPATRDDAATWVLVGKLALAWADHEDAPIPDPLGAALEAWDTAIGKDAEKKWSAEILTQASIIESSALVRATNAFEGDRTADAATWLAVVRRAQGIVRQLGQVDPARELDTLRLSVLTAIANDELAEARTHHTALNQLGERRAGTTLAVARAIAKREGDASALAFVVPFAEASPDDTALFEARLGLLEKLDKNDEIRALLDATRDQVGNALGITLLHAKAWTRLEDWSRAEEAWSRAHELNRGHQDVLRGWAEVSIVRARDLGAQAAKTTKWAERNALRARRDKAFEHARGLLQASRELDPEHLPTLKRLREVFDEVSVDDPEEVAALDQAIQALEAKDQNQ